MSYETAEKIPQALLVGVPLPDVTDEENEESLAELRRLAKTLGFEVVGTITQRRRSLSGGTVLGEGKLKELAKRTGGTGVVVKKAYVKKKGAAAPPELTPDPEDEEVDAVIFDCELTPSQLSNLQGATGAEVLDRTGVIVEIFSRHARTRIARLQVEIARLTYLAPRMRRTGGRGSERMNKAGESNVELDKRKIRDRIAELKETLEAVQKEQSQGRTLRSELPCVALVGYTNAGKSSLMRALTGSEVLVEDKLFATLDTTVRALAPETVPRVLISDTVGFIRKLPHDLVASFRSTLEEARNAWLLLYVVDCSDPAFRLQLQVTRETLAEVVTEDVPWRLVLNKIDRVEDLAALREEFPEGLFLSAKDPADVAGLRETLVEFFQQDMAELEVFVPYTVPKGVGALRSQFAVLGERYDEHGTFLTVRADRADLERAVSNFSGVEVSLSKT